MVNMKAANTREAVESTREVVESTRAEEKVDTEVAEVVTTARSRRFGPLDLSPGVPSGCWFAKSDLSKKDS